MRTAFNKPLTYGDLAVTEVISGCGLAVFSATVQTLAIDKLSGISTYVSELDLIVEESSGLV